MSGRDAAKPTSERLLCSHHGDFAIMSRLPACPICADALVARITDLEAQVGTLQQERDEWAQKLADLSVEHTQALRDADAAEAALDTKEPA